MMIDAGEDQLFSNTVVCLACRIDMLLSKPVRNNYTYEYQASLNYKDTR